MPFFAKGFGRRAGRQPLSNIVGAESVADGSKATPDSKTTPEDSAFVGVMPVAGGSWMMCQDHEGHPFWWNSTTKQWTYDIYNAAAGYVPPRQQQMSMSHNPAAPAAAGFPYSGHAAAQQVWLVPGGGTGPVVVPVGPTSTVIPVDSPQRQESEGSRDVIRESSMVPWVWETLYDEDGRKVWIHSVTGQKVRQNLQV